MKTFELTATALDWAVAKCNGMNVIRLHDLMRQVAEESKYTGDLEWHLSMRPDEFWIPNGRGIGGKSLDSFSPSSDWSQGGPIIEREGIELSHNVIKPTLWCAWIKTWNTNYIKTKGMTGPTPLIAAMRCYVASVLGDELEIPEELQ